MKQTQMHKDWWDFREYYMTTNLQKLYAHTKNHSNTLKNIEVNVNLKKSVE